MVHQTKVPRRPIASIAIEIDRSLQLSLSNYEFEILIEILMDSDDPEITASNLMNCGPRITTYCIDISKKKE